MSLTANSGTKVAVLSKDKSSTANSGIKVAVLLGMKRCGIFPHPTLSLASEHTLKDVKRSQGPSVEVRRADLATWTLQTSLKLTTGVKYQFQQGFCPDQRSRNLNHPSPPYIQSVTGPHRQNDRDYRPCRDGHFL